MRFPAPLQEGRLIRRYKRFLADVALPDGRRVTAHTPNTGAMTGCADPGCRVWLLDSANPRRKYPLSWVLVEDTAGSLVGIDTGLANRLVQEGIESGRIPALRGFDRLRREVRYGRENSRIDLLLEDRTGRRCYLEVKNVTLARDGCALFPDAVSLRGRKHLRELIEVRRGGHRAMIFFCIQREDVSALRPADAIDPAYGATLREALGRGVEALAWDCRVGLDAIELRNPLPVVT
ncbi:MAG TPA: DNA/RNA nuclease SfsA [Gammaproteobacteria bacterium]|nr:DNA/RNA nuclease SfsA [Gammaproteobacteria bacterium]